MTLPTSTTKAEFDSARIQHQRDVLVTALERIANDYRGISNPTNILRDIARDALAAVGVES